MEEPNSNQPGNDDEVYYTLADVCKTLGISRSTLWRKRKSALSFIRCNGVVRIKKSDFERFVKTCEIHPQPPAAEAPKPQNPSPAQTAPDQNNAKQPNGTQS